MAVDKSILAFLNQEIGHVAALSDEDQPWTKQEAQNPPDGESHSEDDDDHIEKTPETSIYESDPHAGEDIHRINNMDSEYQGEPRDESVSKLAAFSQPKSAPMQVQPQVSGQPQQAPTIPGAMQIQPQAQMQLPTQDQLMSIAKFAGQLAAAAEGMKGVIREDAAVAKMSPRGSIIVKVPLGANPSINFELVKELAEDVQKGLYGNLKIWNLQTYSKVGGVQLQAGAAMKHPNLKASHFVLAFSLEPGKPKQAPVQQQPMQPDPNAPL